MAGWAVDVWCVAKSCSEVSFRHAGVYMLTQVYKSRRIEFILSCHVIDVNSYVIPHHGYSLFIQNNEFIPFSLN